MNRYKVLITIVTALCSLLPALLYSQVDTAWVRRYNGPPNSPDEAYAIAVDGTGNVYITGYSYGSGSARDYATVKYNALGVEQWVQRYNGPGNGDDEASSITKDGQSNVYVTGACYGSGTGYDYTTIKYYPNGDTAWIRIYNGPINGSDYARAIAVDDSGNVYVTGVINGYDAARDYATIKYNSNGDTVWTRIYNGPANNADGAYALAVDDAGNVYVTGWSYGSGDDYLTVKYNSNGDTVWTRRYNGPTNFADCAVAITVDDAGNVYVTGGSQGVGSTYPEDYATIKYNSSGVQQWVQRYNGPGDYVDEAYAIAVDDSGNVYVTGRSYASGTNYDYATIKYNPAGVQQWVQRYNGPGNGYDYAYSLALDGQENVYVTGYSTGSGTSYDYATIKYNPASVQQWLIRYNGPGNSTDGAYAMAVDGSGNVYVTGGSYGSGTSVDYATIKYVQTSGIEEIASLPLAKTSRVEVYPNPARSFFVVRMPQTLNQVQGDKCVVKIFDVSGKMVKVLESFGVKELRVPLKGINPGIYFLQINNVPTLKKLVITK